MLTDEDMVDLVLCATEGRGRYLAREAAHEIKSLQSRLAAVEAVLAQVPAVAEYVIQVLPITPNDGTWGRIDIGHALQSIKRLGGLAQDADALTAIDALAAVERGDDV